MRNLPRLAFVLFTGTVIMIFCTLLLSPGFLAADKRPSASRKEQVFIKEEKEENRRAYSNPGLPSTQQQFGRLVSLDTYLLARSFTEEQVESMSPLGKWLLAPEGSRPPRSNTANKTYLILIWKYGEFLERRHIKRFSSTKFSPWDQCSIQNCMLSYDKKDLHRADAVVFHLHFTRSPSELPTRSRADQRWIFLTDESPFHTFLHGYQRLSNYDNLFNWSMSYRMDSDVPVPYGRTIRASSSFPNKHWDAIMKAKTKLVAIMGSNCGDHNGRWSYVKALKSSLRGDLDILGKCLDSNRTVCPGHFDQDCAALNAYKFYLSFENSNCREYLTEKVFWNAYHKFAVPIIMGTSRQDCQRLLPSHSFLYVDDFANAKALADYLRYLDRDNQRYLGYHEWRDHYRVINEHGYFGSISKHYCRICEALHYNPVEPKVYTRLEHFWSKEKDCVPASA